ncbi:MAG: prolyl oligopeptidase family serine peptidase [Bacteroidetes bacterium]|nr:prolyl oligopeptidase family serine peptidase [Bacteroidota bacterium]
MKSIHLLFSFFLMSLMTNAQSVAINATGSPADSSAILDISSPNKGVLLPRVQLLSLTDTVTIRKPALSLLVFNTNKQLPKGAGYYSWNGSNWDVVLSSGNVFVKGKNRYTIIVDSTEREFWVHVPAIYDSTQPTPLVFMLHGTGGNGERFYDGSGWKELGEEEGFISVFPSSLRYFIYTDSTVKRITKWNTTPDAEFTILPGQSPRDDIKFLRKVIDEVRQKFNIDTNRIYMNGFSNGGQMAAKTSIMMSDVLAAVVSNAGTFYLDDTTYTPLRKIPLLYQIGNIDYGPGNTGPYIPLDTFDFLLRTPGLPNFNRYYNIAHRYIRHFGLDSNYTLIGDTNAAMIALYHSQTPGDTLNILRYVFVKELGHKYPNGDNHWFDAPRTHWAWMRNFRRRP